MSFVILYEIRVYSVGGGVLQILWVIMDSAKFHNLVADDELP